MSVINQMLRDLDARRAANEQRALPNEVRPLPARERGRRGLIGAVSMAALVAGATGAMWLLQPQATAPAGERPGVPDAARAPAVVPLTPAEPPLPVLAAAPAEPIVAEPSTPAPPTPAMVPARAAEPPVPVAEPRPATLRLSTDLRLPAAMAAAAAVAAPAIDKQVAAISSGEAGYRKAIAASRQGRAGDAMDLLREALAAEPGHEQARQLLLSIMVERQSWADAAQLLRDGLLQAPGNASWAMALARIEVERGQLPAAWETLDRHMSAGAGNADYRGFAGVVLQRLRRPAEAAAQYQAALRLKPEARWWFGLGMALEADGKAADAREALQRARMAEGLAPEMAALIEQRLR